MICLGVFETDPERKNTIKEWLVRYSIRQNCELELLWFMEEDPISKMEKYAPKLQIALISLDNENGALIGGALYGKNQDCRILYYRGGPCELEPLLASRPISFYLWETGREAFLEKLDRVYQEVLLARTTFRYETKNKMYLLPKGNILYFQSDLRYVNICLLQGENPRILAKLSEIEQLAGEGFLRIHKSYLVNPAHILWMDKKNHSVLLTNGEQLPVSDAQYERACEKLRRSKNHVIPSQCAHWRGNPLDF
ncbi:MAG: LytTR family transcriptional regulator [Oscillospiraceae bacterium]|nr:LytTR family transcriptional regulator [Oscillospiraceae bacterium]